MWGFIHVLYLIGWGNRLSTLLVWQRSLVFTKNYPQRIITFEQARAGVRSNTVPETADIAFAFATKLGKHPIRTKDRSGFIVNFLLTGYIMAAIRMYEEGFASREDIDDGMRLGAGHPMGPLTLADMTGLDIVYSVGNSMYEEFKREEYAPPPLLKRMIAAGRLGR